MSNFPLQTLQFENHNIDCIEIEGKKYITSVNMANALEYSSSKSVTNLFNTNKAEFIEGEDYMVIDMMTVKNAPYKQIFFSMEGVMGITMLAKTGKAVAFRQWARKTLANLPKIQQTPQSQLPQDYIEALERLVCAEKDKLQLQNAVQTQKQEIQVLEYSKEVVEKNLEIKTAEVKEKDVVIETQDNTIQAITNIQDSYSLRQAKSNLCVLESELKEYLLAKKWFQYLSNGECGKDKKNTMQATAYAIKNNFAKDANVENKAQQKFFKQFRITKHGMAFLIKNRNEIIKK